MRSAADVLVGTHDFGSFRAIRCAAKSTRRELTQVDVVRNGEELLLTVSGNAFLRKMVRIICGTLAEVGAGLRPVAHLELALRTQHREFAGITAPAHGLTLECVKLCASAEQVRSTARSAAL
jgi:tRNA pseudouridine38-40 synthase